MTSLYRYFDADDRLLYIGISANAVRRLREHSNVALWFEDVRRVTIEPVGSWTEAVIVERDAIIAEKPAHNVKWSPARYTADPVADLSPRYVEGPNGEKLVVGEPCPDCHKPVPGPAMTNAEKQRRYRERKKAT